MIRPLDSLALPKSSGLAMLCRPSLATGFIQMVGGFLKWLEIPVNGYLIMSAGLFVFLLPVIMCLTFSTDLLIEI